MCKGQSSWLIKVFSLILNTRSMYFFVRFLKVVHVGFLQDMLWRFWSLMRNKGWRSGDRSRQPDLHASSMCYNSRSVSTAVHKQSFKKEKNLFFRKGNLSWLFVVSDIHVRLLHFTPKQKQHFQTGSENNLTEFLKVIVGFLGLIHVNNYKIIRIIILDIIIHNYFQYEKHRRFFLMKIIEK